MLRKLLFDVTAIWWDTECRLKILQIVQIFFSQEISGTIPITDGIHYEGLSTSIETVLQTVKIRSPKSTWSSATELGWHSRAKKCDHFNCTDLREKKSQYVLSDTAWTLNIQPFLKACSYFASTDSKCSHEECPKTVWSDENRLYWYKRVTTGNYSQIPTCSFTYSVLLPHLLTP